ncbi:MAG: haloacid dehalogenase [Anaerolineae bacterium]|nr:haloacid dehalogenase [Anaerolineae bacterium]
MDPLEAIGEGIRAVLESKEEARNNAIQQSRALIRDCANAIRAIHRKEWNLVEERLVQSRESADALRAYVQGYPDLYFTGYTQDALKEYAEAYITHAIVRDLPLPTPEDLGIEPDTYLNGLAEAASELRRHILDIIRHDESTGEAERLLAQMDTVYALLMTFDLSDAVTGGLRRRTDQLRGVLERTRGDLTITLRQQRLQDALSRMERTMQEAEDGAAG